MKKIIVIAIVFFGLTQLNAQVTFRPGVRAGVNFSHFTEGNYYNQVYTYYDQNAGQYYDVARTPSEFKAKTDFYAGFYGALKLSKFYTLQPELDYSRQGSKIEWTDYSNSNASAITRSTQVDVSYVSVGIINKFTFNKFNFHLGPTIDIIVDKSRKSDLYYNGSSYNYYNDPFQANSDIDLAFVLGLGYNFTKNIGLEARVKKGVIPVIDYEDGHTNVVFSFGLNYTFDLK